MSKIQNIRVKIDKLTQFLEPFKELINCHMVDVLTKNHWKTFIPEVIQSEIKCIEDIKSSINFFWTQREDQEDENLVEKHKSLLQFLQHSNSYQLDNFEYCLNIEKLILKLEEHKIPYEAGLNLKIKDFMSEKKNHEIEVAASIIATLSNKLENGLIIDVGDGKGYLSSRLSLEYHLNVLGVDGNPLNTELAEKRNTKLKVCQILNDL